MRFAVILALLPLAACADPRFKVAAGGPPFVSGQSPPTPFSYHGEPQPIGSLPPGAGGLGRSLPQTQPDYGAITVTY